MNFYLFSEFSTFTNIAMFIFMFVLAWCYVLLWEIMISRLLVIFQVRLVPPYRVKNDISNLHPATAATRHSLSTFPTHNSHRD